MMINEASMLIFICIFHTSETQILHSVTYAINLNLTAVVLDI